MRYARLWLAAVWLIFVAVAPVHAATMSHMTCDHMAMPHAPTHHVPPHDGDAMPCCSVPAVIAVTLAVVLPERAFVPVKIPRMPALHLNGVTPASDPHPPKKFEA